MEDKINELGPTTVSKHCANQNDWNVFDVSVNSFKKPAAFLTEIRKKATTVLEDNNCYHIEIAQ